MLVYPKSVKFLQEFLLKHQAWIFLGLTVLAGIFIFSSRGGYQTFVSQGDHGRDLYAFKLVAETNAVPYRDFSWLFGPAMLYYYAGLFKIFGATIQTAVLGQNILAVFTGVILYLACNSFMPAALSFLCALWYWAFRGQEFFYTYNHLGGLVCLMVMVYALLLYIKEGRARDVIAGLVAAFLLAMIRPTMAVAALAGWVLALGIADLVKKRPLAGARVYVYGALAVGLATFFVYWLYFKDLPVYVLWESFPISSAQRTDVTTGPWGSILYLKEVFAAIFSASIVWYFIVALFLLSIVGAVALLIRRKEDWCGIGVGFCGLFIMIILVAHEYLFSGTYYRLYWMFPLVLLFMFLVMGYVVAGRTYRLARWGLYAALFWMAFMTIKDESRNVTALKATGANMLKWHANRVSTFQPPVWYETVQSASDFIEKNVPPGEKLFTVPFDTLYNFLTGRDQPTRQWVYFEHFIIPREQDMEIIKDLERERVNWILISNRAISLEPGLGVFGRDYCHELWKYMGKNFVPVAQFGLWTSRASWAWDHGVIIFKRKTPFVGK